MAYKYTKAQALQKAIILDKLTDTLKANIADADRSLQTTRSDEASADWDSETASIQSAREMSACYLRLIELLDGRDFEGEVTL